MSKPIIIQLHDKQNINCCWACLLAIVMSMGFVIILVVIALSQPLDRIYTGEQVTHEEHLKSHNRQFLMSFTNGRYAVTYPGRGGVLFEHNSFGEATSSKRPILKLTEDNLILLDDNHNVYWKALERPVPLSHLVLNDDGDLLLYVKNGALIWKAPSPKIAFPGEQGPVGPPGLILDQERVCPDPVETPKDDPCADEKNPLCAKGVESPITTAKINGDTHAIHKGITFGSDSTPNVHHSKSTVVSGNGIQTNCRVLLNNNLNSRITHPEIDIPVTTAQKDEFEIVIRDPPKRDHSDVKIIKEWIHAIPLTRKVILESPDGSHQLRMQEDSNLVIYDTKTNKPTWASGTDRIRWMRVMNIEVVVIAVLSSFGFTIGHGDRTYWTLFPGEIKQEINKIVLTNYGDFSLYAKGETIPFVINPRDDQQMETFSRCLLHMKWATCADILEKRWM